MFKKPTIYGEVETITGNGCGYLSVDDRVRDLQNEITLLQSALETEQKNQCCGNCRYMDTIFDITGERQCGITKFSVDRESDPCEHWRTCRG